ncbi:MBL fold metallo-hydrolase [Streptomyces pimonensis]|uniref:MBL fold metallo-hydrolase n=1 Tax=Streptomyces pimonensis TaxID=2860288 RepID=A0ABV4IXU7_9ACTN
MTVGGETYLVDCGRGAVTQYLRAGLSMPSLKGILLTHLHADHIVDYFGFPLLCAGVMPSQPGPGGTAGMGSGAERHGHPGPRHPRAARAGHRRDHPPRERRLRRIHQRLRRRGLRHRPRVRARRDWAVGAARHGGDRPGDRHREGDGDQGPARQHVPRVRLPVRHRRRLRRLLRRHQPQ